jgi:hypothetical protein
LKSGKGLEFFLNLLRGEGIESISLFWEKKMLKDGNRRWVGRGFYFLNVVILDGGREVRLYFFTRFTLLMFVVFSTIFTLKGRGESRVKGFFI